jgi:DNA-binding LytR/AlgR family response regulator
MEPAPREKSLVIKPLSKWEERLPEKHFASIHRSTIINIEFVERVEKSFNYSFEPPPHLSRCPALLRPA